MTNSFDEFSKSLATDLVPRRESLRRLGAVLTGAVFGPLMLGSNSESADGWQRDRKRCGKKGRGRKDECADFCKRCGNSAKRAQCVAACRSCDNSPKRLRGGCGSYICCASGLTYCKGRCVDFKNDSSNCGSCGRVCRDGKTCVNGRCRDSGGNECDPGLTKCEFACVNLSSDNSNCGSCGNVCGSGTTCVNGTCTGSGNECAAGQTRCGTTCVYLYSDPNNCGACGNVCSGSTPFCQGGTCAAENSGCPGVDLMWDSRNCGACGNVCEPQSACAWGVCEGVCIGCG